MAIKLGHVTLDTDRHQLSCGGVEVDLSPEACPSPPHVGVPSARDAGQ